MPVTWPIPSAYRDILMNTAQNKGIPASWLAACCEQTGWQPDFLRLNAGGSPRQFGIAGIWAILPEITFGPGSILGTTLLGGWVAAALYRGSILWPYAPARCWPPLDSAGEIDLAKTPAGSLAAAADILKDCSAIVSGICGGLNTLLWLRWQWGCRWVPEAAVGGGCVAPAAAQQYIDIVNKLSADEAEYAALMSGPPALTVGLQASPSQAQVFSNITFTASATGGVPPYSYHFDFGDGAFMDTASPTAVHQYALAQVYTAFVEATDAAGTTARSVSLPISITFSTLQADLTATPLVADPGVDITFRVNASGGVPTYQYRFDFGDGQSAQGDLPEAVHAYGVGTFSARATVTDSLGDQVVTNAVTLVIGGGGGGDGGGGDNTGLIVVGALVGLLGLIGLAGLAGRGDKRKRAAELRLKAAKIRNDAAILRGQGKWQEADALEAQARTLEEEASRLEQQAAREEMEEAQRKMEAAKRR